LKENVAQMERLLGNEMRWNRPCLYWNMKNKPEMRQKGAHRISAFHQVPRSPTTITESENQKARKQAE
jgi:hypothetical protein